MKSIGGQASTRGQIAGRKPVGKSSSLQAPKETVIETGGWRDKFTAFLEELSVVDWVPAEIYAGHFNILAPGDSRPKPKTSARRCKTPDNKARVMCAGPRVLRAASKDVHDQESEFGLCG
jgi:hypothetical protein